MSDFSASADPDEDVINEILGHRSLQQRLAIQETYKRLYDKEITEHIGSVLIGSYDSLIKTLFRNPMEMLANDLYKGIKNLGSNYQIMTDIICCCNNTEIYLLKKAYEKAEKAGREGNIKELHDTTKKVAGNYCKPERPVKSKEGKVIINIEEQRNRWVEHSEELLNRPAPLNLPNIEVPPMDLPIDVGPPTIEDINMSFTDCFMNDVHQDPSVIFVLLMKEDPKGYRQRSLHIDIMKESKGSYKLLMEQLLKGERCEDNTNKIAESTSIVHGGVDQKLVDDDVTELYEAGEG
ncbi:unnamed protein product [Schistosoma margrebowiei]|uniref:Uncharacterized protein n=1 Tax=Schistosoma margrebowiei TaxID=48269 RepID=A0A183LXX3_9TREM|nr:unnamed protein product [Schistosoma margrebowiei]